jgi:hypothetical protein
MQVWRISAPIRPEIGEEPAGFFDLPNPIRNEEVRFPGSETGLENDGTPQTRNRRRPRSIIR